MIQNQSFGNTISQTAHDKISLVFLCDTSDTGYSEDTVALMLLSQLLVREHSISVFTVCPRLQFMQAYLKIAARDSSSGIPA